MAGANRSRRRRSSRGFGQTRLWPLACPSSPTTMPATARLGFARPSERANRPTSLERCLALYYPTHGEYYSHSHYTNRDVIPTYGAQSRRSCLVAAPVFHCDHRVNSRQPCSIATAGFNGAAAHRETSTHGTSPESAKTMALLKLRVIALLLLGNLSPLRPFGFELKYLLLLLTRSALLEAAHHTGATHCVPSPVASQAMLSAAHPRRMRSRKGVRSSSSATTSVFPAGPSSATT